MADYIRLDVDVQHQHADDDGPARRPLRNVANRFDGALAGAVEVIEGSRTVILRSAKDAGLRAGIGGGQP